MTAETSRVPAGFTNGGQFAATVHAEAPVRLFNRSDGSFLKPSPSSTAEHCINFWSSVNIPDEIIEQAEKAYAAVREEEIATDMETASKSWAASYVAENPQPRREGKELDKWTGRYQAELEAYQESIVDGITNSRPRYLGSYDARQVVRAAQMYHHRPHGLKFPEESFRVLDYQVELFDGVMTVEEIERVYQMDKIYFCLEEVQKDDRLQQLIVDRLTEVSGGIQNVRKELTFQTNLHEQEQY